MTYNISCRAVSSGSDKTFGKLFKKGLKMEEEGKKKGKEGKKEEMEEKGSAKKRGMGGIRGKLEAQVKEAISNCIVFGRDFKFFGTFNNVIIHP